MKDKLTVIRITESSRDKIKILAEKKDLKMVTVLEYILKGNIDINELN